MVMGCSYALAWCPYPGAALGHQKYLLQGCSSPAPPMERSTQQRRGLWAVPVRSDIRLAASYRQPTGSLAALRAAFTRERAVSLRLARGVLRMDRGSAGCGARAVLR